MYMYTIKSKRNTVFFRITYIFEEKIYMYVVFQLLFIDMSPSVKQFLQQLLSGGMACNNTDEVCKDNSASIQC